jgi:prepilin-type N-terminal cleavage/methylation domain-containing protein
MFPAYSSKKEGIGLMTRQQGFSLIELLIVVTIIGILAAVAVPNLLKSRAAANEASAIASVRTIVTAQITYSATVGNGSYAADLSELESAGLLDAALASGSKDGYTFLTAGTAEAFTVNADPTDMGSSGNRGFFSDQSAVIRYATGAAADASSPPLGS